MVNINIFHGIGKFGSTGKALVGIVNWLGSNLP